MKNIFFLIVQLSFCIATFGQNAADFHTSVITQNNIVCSSFINDHEGWVTDNLGNVWHTHNAAPSWAIGST